MILLSRLSSISQFLCWLASVQNTAPCSSSLGIHTKSIMPKMLGHFTYVVPWAEKAKNVVCVVICPDINAQLKLLNGLCAQLNRNACMVAKLTIQNTAAQIRSQIRSLKKSVDILICMMLSEESGVSIMLVLGLLTQGSS